MLTLRRLREKGACEHALTHFENQFGESVVVTVARAAKYAVAFDFDWAGTTLLSPRGRKAFRKVTEREYDWYAVARAWARIYISEGRGK